MYICIYFLDVFTFPVFYFQTETCIYHFDGSDHLTCGCAFLDLSVYISAATSRQSSDSWDSFYIYSIVVAYILLYIDYRRACLRSYTVEFGCGYILPGVGFCDCISVCMCFPCRWHVPKTEETMPKFPENKENYFIFKTILLNVN